MPARKSSGSYGNDDFLSSRPLRGSFITLADSRSRGWRRLLFRCVVGRRIRQQVSGVCGRRGKDSEFRILTPEKSVCKGPMPLARARSLRVGGRLNGRRRIIIR